MVKSPATAQLIAIFGGNGFVGKHLQAKLNASKKNFAVFEGDILDVERLETFFSQNKPQIIINLATKFFGSEDELFASNILTTKAICECAIKHKAQKMIYTSTGAALGEPLAEVSYETDPRIPNTYYGLTKAIGEEIVEYTARSAKLSHSILRFPNVYGPGSEKGVIYAMLKDALQKEEVTIQGDGSAARNFLHVSDAADSIMLAIDSDKSGIFHITNQQKVTVKEIAEQLHEKYDAKITSTAQVNNLKSLLLDDKKAEKELGFTAKKKVIDWDELRKSI